MVVRFVCVIRVPVCARVSRVRYPYVSRLPPVSFFGFVVGFGWMVVKFVCVFRVPACARVSRVCPGSPRCLLTGC